ncbi:lipocalin-like domain-containing protein [Pedobacter miscanthi]|uniref:lipocalin-like domain-containing protein n=1 Tax=Pedobacter miscanthi TaxID=2259170 RepID=UPI00292F5B0C|nr:glycoside hydrolase family 43 C-terminal domain-containing protein [Pedobacter miscanthi]
MQFKLLITFLFCIAGFVSYAQTSKELIGKWKLVSETKDGVVKTPKDTYQVFVEGGEFKGINGDNSRKGKWKLSDDNKKLTIKISIISLTFTVDYFDSKKRIISNDKTGSLEYEKVYLLN